MADKKRETDPNPKTPDAAYDPLTLRGLLAVAARNLAIKGFAAEEAEAEDAGASFEVRSASLGLAGYIAFQRHPTAPAKVHWQYTVASSTLALQEEQGYLDSRRQAETVIEAFVSVFTTMASFSGTDAEPPESPPAGSAL